MDKPLVFYRFSGNVMNDALNIYGKTLMFSRQKYDFKSTLM